jgi:hypothetical protein
MLALKNHGEEIIQLLRQGPLDYFGQGTSGAQGRWISPDRQWKARFLELRRTWNRYSLRLYNRPAFATDPAPLSPPSAPSSVV